MKHVIPLLTLLLLLTACGESSTQASQSTSIPSPTLQPSPTPTAPKHFAVGRPVKIYFAWEITVQSAKAMPVNDLGDSNSEKPLQASDKFLVISLHIKNLAPFEQDFTTQDFTLKDSHSALPQRMSLSLPVRTDPSSKLAPNDQVEGDVAYEVGSDQTHFTLTYQGPPANSKTPEPTLFTWDVNV